MSYQTTSQKNDTPNIHRVSDEPDLPQMQKEITDAFDGAFDYYDRMERALNTRECYWPGQSADGRKHGSEERAPFPWEGASDARVRTADMIVSERVDLLLLTLSRMAIQVIPANARDIEYSGRMAALLRWYLHNEMADEADAEIELLATYQETFGSAVLGVGWWQQLSYENKHVTLQDVLAMAAQRGGQQLVADVGTMLFDPRNEETLIGWIQGFSSLLTKGEARRVLQDLQTRAETDLAIPFVAASRPCITALQCMQDVVFPVNTWRLQRARFIAQRELLSEPELLEKAEGPEQWDKEFVQAALEKKGEQFNTNLAAMALTERQRELGGIWSTRWDDSEELIEIWHFYHQASYRGVPTLYRTVMHPGCADYHGLHEAFTDLGGEYPHVEFVRERRTRSILASRGLPELIDTHQSEIKVQRDGRIDRSSMTTLPPILEKLRAGQKQTVFGPGVVIPVTRVEDIQAMRLGAPDPTSIEVERATKFDVNEIVGRHGVEVPPPLVDLKQQSSVSRWLKRWKAAGTMMLTLAQKYTPPTTVARIAGVIPKPYEVNRENIAGGFSLMLNFDARFASADFVFGLMERVEKYIIPLDTNAVVNRDALIRYVFAALDPTLADLVVRDTENAQQSEIEDEQQNVALMVSGVEPPMKLKGQNHAARLQVLQQVFGRNQEFYSALLQVRPDFAAIVQKRIDFLQQQVAQQQNKLIGIYGTTPSPSSGAAQQQQQQMGAFAMGGAA